MNHEAGSSVPMRVRSTDGIRLALAFVLGAAAASVLGERSQWFQPLADVFIVSLTALGPLLAALVLATALTSLREQRLGRLGGKTLAVYVAAALIAASVGVACAVALRVGVGLEPEAAAILPNRPMSLPPSIGSLSTWIRGPYVYALLGAIFVFCLLHETDGNVGRRNAREWLSRATAVSYRMVAVLMRCAPVGVFALAALAFSRMRLEAAAALIVVIVAVYAGQLLTAAGCLFALRRAGRTPLEFLRDAKLVLLTAFLTGSSAATIALEFETAERRLGIARAPLGVVLPLGLAIYKLGTAVQQSVVLAFAAQAHHGALSVEAMAMVALLAAFASMITPPISGGSWIALGLVGGLAGLPMHTLMIAMALPLLGKLNTPLNSLGRLTGVTLLAGAP